MSALVKKKGPNCYFVVPWNEAMKVAEKDMWWEVWRQKLWFPRFIDGHVPLWRLLGTGHHCKSFGFPRWKIKTPIPENLSLKLKSAWRKMDWIKPKGWIVGLGIRRMRFWPENPAFLPKEDLRSSFHGNSICIIHNLRPLCSDDSKVGMSKVTSASVDLYRVGSFDK